MNFKILTLASLLFLSSCSTPPKAKLQPENIQQPVVLQFDEQKKEKAPRPLTPEKRKDISDYKPIMPAGGGMAEVALMGALIGIFAVTTANEPRTDLRGTCMYGEPETLVTAAPCIHVKVRLLTDENKVASEMTTNEKGDFRFFIPAHKTYSVQVVDRKGRNALLQKQVGRADYVSIFIKP